MFVVHGHRAGDAEPLPVRVFSSFEDAAKIACSCVAPLVIEFSSLYGWLSIWELAGDRFELLAESADAYVMRGRAR